MGSDKARAAMPTVSQTIQIYNHNPETKTIPNSTLKYTVSKYLNYHNFWAEMARPGWFSILEGKKQIEIFE